jgi:hypothetical protein
MKCDNKIALVVEIREAGVEVNNPYVINDQMLRKRTARNPQNRR